MRRRIHGILVPFGLLALVLSAAPALAAEPPDETAEAPTLSYPEGSERAAVLERARAYWDAKIARSPEVFSFYPPVELGGPKRPRGEQGSIRYREYEIRKVVVDGERAGVVIKVVTTLPAQQAMKVPDKYRHLLNPELVEEWNRIEGTWYKKPLEKGGLSRFMRRNRQRRAEAEPAAKAEAKAETISSDVAAKEETATE